MGLLRSFVLFLVAIVILAFGYLSAPAEHLPIKIFSSIDGLGSSFIDSLYRDSRGFMWFCTRDGLSRFDGSQFVTYQIGNSGAVSGVESIFEQSNGTYWVGTTNGFYRFTAETLSQPNPAKNGRPLLNAEFVGDQRGHMYEDRFRKLWFISAGLWTVSESDGKVVFDPVDFHVPDQYINGLNIVENQEDTDGSLWFNVPRGVVRRMPDGRTVFFETDLSLQPTITLDKRGLIWVGRGKEVYVIKPQPMTEFADKEELVHLQLKPSKVFSVSAGDELQLPTKPGEIFGYTSPQFLSKHLARRLFVSSDGHVWLTTDQNLVEYDGSTLLLHTTSEGFPPGMSRMEEDNAGNIWFVGFSGLVRLDRKGMRSYDTADGLSSSNIYSIIEDAAGQIYVATGELSIAKWTGHSFTAVHPQTEPGATPIWTSPLAYLDREGDWWMATSKGLSRFAGSKNFEKLEGAAPTSVFNKGSGLVNDEAFHIFEERNGDILFSQLPASPGRTLVRWNRATGELHTFTNSDGYPEGRSVLSFAEDNAGAIWMGLYEGGLLRYRAGRFEQIGDDKFLRGPITDMYVDRSNRMWIATAIAGLYITDDPTGDKPSFRQITTSDGLSSNNVRTICGDALDRIYVGTVRGVDRLTPETMRIKHFTVNDGLSSDFVVDSHRDMSGEMWFATTNGLSRLHPEDAEQPQPPKILLGKLVIAGEEQPIAELGSTSVDKGELSSTQNNLQIDFFGLDLRAGQSLRYQYKFDSEPEWSQSTSQRSVTFAKLSPGNYHFLVRAIDSDGQVSSSPATVNFRILPPIWLRWWFLTFVTLAVALAAITIYRYRVATLRRINAALEGARSAEERLRLSREERIRELESVRSRIATDLHDDIGASLTQIAVLSEVGQAQANKGNGGPPESLKKISEVSNELIGTMGDIVWSINPSKDHLRDLTQRMRRVAADLLSPKGIIVHFDSREEDKSITIKTNVRREVFLIFKESINNIVKHSASKNVLINVSIANDLLKLRIEDDGCGFSIGPPTYENTFSSEGPSGNGLRNMRRRASEMGGTFDIDSEPGRGTISLLVLPLDETTVASKTEFP